MTDTQELDDAVTVAQPGDHVPAGEMPADLVLVDPRSLVVDANVRSEVMLDRVFVGSVKDLGVLVPISARRCDGGVLKVVLGQRRTLAAVEACRDLVPDLTGPRRGGTTSPSARGARSQPRWASCWSKDTWAPVGQDWSPRAGDGR